MKIRFIVFILSLILFKINSLVYAQDNYWYKIDAPYNKSSGGLFYKYGALYLCDNGLSYSSTDNGKHWIQNILGEYYKSDPLIDGPLIRYSDGFYASTDQGVSWGYIHFYDYMSIVYSVCTVSDTATYLGSNNGVFLVIKPGKDMKHLGLFYKNVQWIFYNGIDELYAISDNKAYFSKYPFTEWKELMSLDKFYTVIQDHNHFLYSTSDNGIFRSTDFGRTWNLISTKIRGNYNIQLVKNKFFIYPSEMLDVNPSISVSTDSLKTFSQLSLPNNLIYSIAIDSNHLFLESEAGLFLSTDL